MLNINTLSKNHVLNFEPILVKFIKNIFQYLIM
jgi:hypothetical protein